MTATPHLLVPDPEERARLNTDLLTHGHETGFWDEHGVPAPWPDDIDEWRPVIYDPPTLAPGEPPF